MKIFTSFIALLGLPALVIGQGGLMTPAALFVSINDPVVAFVHVRVIDGTGGPARADQTVVIDHGSISAAGDSSRTAVPAGARELNLNGFTVYPGLVGMHEHLFYPAGGGMPVYGEQAFSAPRLYLASGITTMRTAGSLAVRRHQHQALDRQRADARSEDGCNRSLR